MDLKPLADTEAPIQTGNARFAFLTDWLIRLEFHPDSCFEDRASQSFWFREQPVPKFLAEITPHNVEIEVAYLHLCYQPGEQFTPNRSARPLERI